VATADDPGCQACRPLQGQAPVLREGRSGTGGRVIPPVAEKGVRVDGSTQSPDLWMRRGTINHSRDRWSQVVDGTSGRQSPISRDITMVRSASSGFRTYDTDLRTQGTHKQPITNA